MHTSSVASGGTFPEREGDSGDGPGMETDEEVALNSYAFWDRLPTHHCTEPICQDHHHYSSGDSKKRQCGCEAVSTIATAHLTRVNEFAVSEVKRRDGRFINRPLVVHSAHETSSQRGLEITHLLPNSGEVSGRSLSKIIC